MRFKNTKNIYKIYKSHRTVIFITKNAFRNYIKIFSYPAVNWSPPFHCFISTLPFPSDPLVARKICPQVYMTVYLTHATKSLKSSAGQKFPVVYITRRSITAFTKAQHLFLSQFRLIQFTASKINFLSFDLRLGFPHGVFPTHFPTV